MTKGPKITHFYHFGHNQIFLQKWALLLPYIYWTLTSSKNKTKIMNLRKWWMYRRTTKLKSWLSVRAWGLTTTKNCVTASKESKPKKYNFFLVILRFLSQDISLFLHWRYLISFFPLPNCLHYFYFIYYFIHIYFLKYTLYFYSLIHFIPGIQYFLKPDAISRNRNCFSFFIIARKI